MPASLAASAAAWLLREQITRQAQYRHDTFNDGLHNGVAANPLFGMRNNPMSEQQGGDAMVDYLILLVQKAIESFLTAYANKLAERLAAPKEPKTGKRPTSPRRRKQRR